MTTTDDGGGAPASGPQSVPNPPTVPPEPGTGYWAPGSGASTGSESGEAGPPAVPPVPPEPLPGGGGGGGRAWGRVVALLGVAVVVGAGVAVSATLALSGSSSSSSPDQAVRALLDSAQKSDLLGVMDSLEPAERDALKGGVTTMVSQMQRLGILSSSADLSNVSGLSLQFSNVTTATSFVRPDLAAVTLQAGTGSVQFDPAQLPVGSFTRSVAGSALSHAHALSHSGPIKTGKAVIATVKVGGNWYVSLGYTVAENARRNAGVAPPDPSKEVAAVGAPDPQSAVRSFFQSLAAFDVAGMIKLTPPDEFAALHEYAPLFVPQAQAALDHVKSSTSVTLNTLDLSSTPRSDGSALVEVTNIGFTVIHGQTTVHFANGCVTITDASDPTNNFDFCPKQAGSLSQFPPELQRVLQHFENLHAAEGFVAIEEGGLWYVDPVRTVLTDVDDLLAVLTPQDLQDIRKAIVDFGSGGASASSS